MSRKTIFTIARQYGSRGKEIGRKIAQKLDIPFYDKELIALAAKESGMSEEIFEDADERATNSLLYSMMMGSYTFGNQISPMNNMPINDRLFIIQSDIIKKAALEGPFVVVGRCADYILRERKNVLNVFIHAEKSFRVNRAIQEYQIEPNRASDFVAKKDKQRGNYYNFYTNRRWDDLSNYQLSLDSSALGVQTCVDLILSAADLLEGNALQV